LKFQGLNNIFKQSEDFNAVLSAVRGGRVPCQVHGLSESQKAYVSCCLFEALKGQFLILTHNDIEAKKLYDDISAFTDRCIHFPVKEMVLNIDVTSGDIKTERLKAIGRILKGEELIVVTSIDAIFYKMPPKNKLENYPLKVSPEDTVDILELSSSLIDMGYERVDVVEGKGQFAQRGGIIDIFSPISDEPCRLEFFGDEIDTIRSFDLISQRSRDKVDEALIYPAREVIIHKNDVEEIVQRISRDFDSRYKSYSKKNQVF
jgi:transcription-repair coupling factor (superfamily II helicase)